MNRTVGVDLASQDKKTALCVIDWAPRPRIVELTTGVGDTQIVATVLTGGVQKAAIDAPFGWPEPFVEAIAAHHAGAGFPTRADQRTEREPFYFRATDRAVIDLAGKRPLSVSTDKIAYIALRCAGILQSISDANPAAVARDGSGLVAEVYPGAALARWQAALGCAVGGYKTKGESAPRRALAEAVFERVGLDEKHLEECARSDDALDAVLCAVIARAVARGRTEPIPAEHRELSLREGWIHVPCENALDHLNP